MKIIKYFLGLLFFSIVTLGGAVKPVKYKTPYKYNPHKGKKYDPSSSEKFKVSRSDLDLFFKCPRCFYISYRLGVHPEHGFPFKLNEAVDKLLKAEFDTYRKDKKPHPLFIKSKLNLVPYHDQERIDYWRDAFHGKGIQYAIPGTKFVITGGIDDIVEDDKGVLYVVDFKATAQDEEITLDEAWKDNYKRQLEVYEWLLRKNGYTVSDTAYFFYCNGNANAGSFNNALHFDSSLLAYTRERDDAWWDKTVNAACECLQRNKPPKEKGKDCGTCIYFDAVIDVLKPFQDEA